MIFRCYGSPFCSRKAIVGIALREGNHQKQIVCFHVQMLTIRWGVHSILISYDFFRVGSMSTFQCMFASWTLFGFDNARKLCNWKRFPSCRVSAQDVTQNWLSRIVPIVTCELKEGLPEPKNHSISKYFDALPEIQRPMWPCLEACKLHLHQ